MVKHVEAGAPFLWRCKEVTTVVARCPVHIQIVHEILMDYSPVKSGGRFSVKAVIASTKSFDWMKAAFHRAT